MRIAHYAPDLWAPGGISSWIRRVGRAQEERGDTVFYVGRVGQSTGEAGLYRVEDEADLFEWAQGSCVDILHVHKTLANEPPDGVDVLRTVHDHSANCASGSRHLARLQRPCNRVSRLATCTWGHLVDGCGSRRLPAMRRNFARLKKERRTLQALPVHTVSRHLKERMVLDGYDESQIHVLHSPAPPPSHLDRKPPRTECPRFLFVGRIVPEKGLATLLRALPQLDVPVHVDVAGDGYQKRGMEQLARRLEVEHQVTFHGWVPHSEVQTLMEEARAIVFPSVWHEPAGLVSLEAATAGRAVIASRVGGIPEYATEEYAMLVPPGSPTKLARAVTKLATNYELANSLGEQGRSFVRDEFDMPTFLSGLDVIYDTTRLAASQVPVP